MTKTCSVSFGALKSNDVLYLVEMYPQRASIVAWGILLVSLNTRPVGWCIGKMNAAAIICPRYDLTSLCPVTPIMRHAVGARCHAAIPSFRNLSYGDAPSDWKQNTWASKLGNQPELGHACSLSRDSALDQYQTHPVMPSRPVLPVQWRIIYPAESSHLFPALWKSCASWPVDHSQVAQLVLSAGSLNTKSCGEEEI